jgi:CDGSH-type Zn-finger protein
MGHRRQRLTLMPSACSTDDEDFPFTSITEAMMSDEQVRVAGTSPMGVELEAGKKYAFCACGHSQGQPFCDGSHKGTSFTPHVFTAESSEKKWFCMCKHTKSTPYCDGTHNTLDQAEA